MVKYLRNIITFGTESGIKDWKKTSKQNAVKALLNDFMFINDDIVWVLDDKISKFVRGLKTVCDIN